jgi:hypothetical protein
MMAGAARFGRRWLRTGDGFAALFSLIAAMAPWTRDEAGHVRWRWPIAGLANLSPIAGTRALVLVTLGGTTFDGFTRTRIWAETVAGDEGWALTLRNTMGMGWTIAAVWVVYATATRLIARMVDDDPIEVADRYAPSLVPIVLGYAVAHYFSLLAFEGQAALINLSDPLGRGWDLLGTAGWVVNYRLVTATQIAWVQVVAIVVGHIAGVTVAHDRAVTEHDPATASRSQYPLLAAMVAFTVVGLVLLLNA